MPFCSSLTFWKYILKGMSQSENGEERTDVHQSLYDMPYGVCSIVSKAGCLSSFRLWTPILLLTSRREAHLDLALVPALVSVTYLTSGTQQIWNCQDKFTRSFATYAWVFRNAGSQGAASWNLALALWGVHAMGKGHVSVFQSTGLPELPSGINCQW